MPTGEHVAPLVHGKPKFASVEDRAGYASAAEGFNIDIAEAKAFRDVEHRLAVLLRKRYAPSAGLIMRNAVILVDQIETESPTA